MLIGPEFSGDSRGFNYGKARPYRGRMAVIGDSIGFGPGTYPCSFPHVAACLSLGKWKVVGNLSVGGTTAAQIEATLPAAFALNPAVVVIMAGTNDRSSPADALAPLTRMVRTCLANSVLPILCTIPYCSDGAGPNYNIVAEVQINQYINAIANQFGVPLCDTASVWVDPATGLFLSGTNGDTVHPNGAGHRLAGALLLSKLPDYNAADPGSIYIPQFEMASHSKNNGSIALNSLFLYDAPGAGQPAQWTASGAGSAGTPSVAAGSGSLQGQWFVMTRGGGDSGSRTILYQDLVGTLLAGTTYALVGRVQTTGLEAGGYTLVASLITTAVTAWETVSDISDGLFYVEYTPDVNKVNPTIKIVLNGSGACTVNIGQFSVMPQTATLAA
jgi:lysophospholipase L1-like esterase